MARMNLTVSGAFLLGAGLLYLLDNKRDKGRGVDPSRAQETLAASDRTASERAVSWAPETWAPGLQCFAGALGIATVAYVAKLIAQRTRKDTATYTALDTDMPNYAWLR